MPLEWANRRRNWLESFSNVIPSWHNRSMAGVRISLVPNAEIIAASPKSSARITITFGFFVSVGNSPSSRADSQYVTKAASETTDSSGSIGENSLSEKSSSFRLPASRSHSDPPTWTARSTPQLSNSSFQRELRPCDTHANAFPKVRDGFHNCPSVGRAVMISRSENRHFRQRSSEVPAAVRIAA